MSTWTPEQLQRIAEADDFHVAPYRADGRTPGTLTWIWSVVVDDVVYVRAYNGVDGRWYQSALAQRAGRVTAAGEEHEVGFAPVDDADLQDRIDAAYSTKYAGSAYLPSMVSDRARAATVRVDPR
ncbi:DUF2255 family protein [Micrococcus sp. ACRRV]|uniref:DUF2255 family protein n=1 Tax=Micrococcus sp. ACRRV TaxID=2918203 RepID=UPI001EF28FE4|nr:DUF2255 family protein [Micrococcus sp. ACRRV]MCG7421457.1 DUF2255 family protein [Micrococcus sp. ACRRV]